MSQEQKKIKLVPENTDLISQLPKEIHSLVVSLLPLREAIKTSVLSKSWKSVWTSRTHIVCDLSSILGTLHDASGNVCPIVRKEHKDKFIERVDDMMMQRFSGPNMKSILINFPLSRRDEFHLTGWISTAVMKGVEEITVNLYGASSCIRFPFSILTAPGQACTVKHLRLISCNLRSISVTNSTLDSLVSIEMRGVDFTDEELDVILSNCVFLQKFVLRKCHGLVSFKLTSRNCKLRILDIKLCPGLKSIEISSESLELLELTGKVDHFSFTHAPKLVEVFACIYGALADRVKFPTYALSGIANDVPGLETLNIQLSSVLPLPKGIFTFTNMKYLVFTFGPCVGEDVLDWISYILMAFPSLNQLQLNFPLIASSTGPSNKNSRELPEVSHKHLREIEMNGYHGSQGEVKRVKYLVNSALKLDLLVISSRAKIYINSKAWFRKNHHYNEQKSRSKMIEELRLVVPKAVRVDYRNL